MALEGGVFVDWAGAVDAGMEAVVRAKRREKSAFGKNFRGRSRNEQLVGIERVDDFAGVQRIELNAKIRVSKFGPADYLLDALRESRLGLCVRRRGLESENKHQEQNI